jgi:hypothetical protein
MRNGRGCKGCRVGSNGDVVDFSPGARSVVLEARVATTVCEGVEDRRKPVFEAEFTSTSSTLFHNVWRVKGIILSIFHPAMLLSLLKAIFHAGLKHFIKYA